MTRARLPRIFIIEGITGAGKDSSCTELLELLHANTRPVYYFPEEPVGFYYHQIFWPRLQTFACLLWNRRSTLLRRNPTECLVPSLSLTAFTCL